MHLLNPTTIDDMIAVFLQAELACVRFGPTILRQLQADGQDRRIGDRLLEREGICYS